MTDGRKIGSFGDLRAFVARDVRNRGKSLTLRTLAGDPVVRFTIALRVNEYLRNTGWPAIVRLLPMWWFRRMSVRLGFSVPLNVFASGLVIVHYGSLIVSPAARIGRNCRVHAGVNIGGAAGLVSAEEAAARAPVIGDNCYIGPGAKIFGGITIGSNCVIGANAVVGRSFPEDGRTLAGVPARVIATRGSEGLLIRGDEPPAAASAP